METCSKKTQHEAVLSSQLHLKKMKDILFNLKRSAHLSLYSLFIY